jgi:outer membrane protein assembly factor BamB
VLVLVLPAVLAPSAVAADWPGWRGAGRDGISTESGLVERWPEGGPLLVWRATGLGEGYSSVAVRGPVLVTMGTAGRNETVIAVDVETGKLRWSHEHGPMFRNDRGDGPRGTPILDGERVYALGANGNLSCLELDTGRPVWSRNLLRDFDSRNIRWGLSESPLVLEDRVLVMPGGRGAALAALDKETGKTLWTALSDEAGYSSGVVATLAGVRQAVYFTAERALGVAVDDGRLLWDYGRVANRTANAATPIVEDDLVFVSSDYGTGCALLRIGEGGAEEVYFSRNMRNHHASSVLVGGHLYGFSGSILTALELRTGEVAWRDRSVGKGSLVYADGDLYLLSEDGVVGLAEATPAGYREKSRFEMPRASSRPSWAHPAIAGGRLYLRDQDVLLSYDIRAGEE